ncbi:MAG: CoA pyrophosphatase [Elusimicrobiota bacterium]
MPHDFEPIRARLRAREPRRSAEAEPRSGQAAVSLILTRRAGSLAAFFIKRADHPADPWSGQVGLPGGRRDPEDRDLLDTARRETFEETGIALEAPALLGELDDIRPRGPGLPRIVVRPFVFGLARMPAVRPSPEVERPFWAGLRALRESDGKAEVLVRERTARVAAYRAGRHVIWGLTYRILRKFLRESPGLTA